MPINVFISYDSRDTIRATKFVERLALRVPKDVVSIIWDRTLPHGGNIVKWIEENLKTAHVFLPLISKNYVSNPSYARMEYEQILIRHLKLGTRIVPIFLENVEIGDLPPGISPLRAFLDYAQDASFADLVSSIAPAIATPSRPIPTQRRIRIQVTSACSQVCDWCHHDEFPKRDATVSDRTVPELIENLVRDFQTYGGRPGARLEFAFTGGEPLASKRAFDAILNAIPAPVLAECDLLTNAYYLDANVQDMLNARGLKKLQITFNNYDAPFFKDHIRIKVGDRADYVDRVLTNIWRISHDGFTIRANHALVTEEAAEEIQSTLDYIAEKSDNRIADIAFFQEYRSPKDIFVQAEEWATNKVGVVKTEGTSRMHCYRLDHRTVRFIKSNCAVMGKDGSSACLQCVLDKDISITSDGRIQLCSELSDDDHRAFRLFPHVDTQNPWQGISAAIRRQYATAGFYRHIPRLVALRKSGPGSGGGVKQMPAEEQLERISEALDRPVLFEESIDDEHAARAAVATCETVLGHAYKRIGGRDIVALLAVNIDLLILIHLCVDETMYSMGRTIMVRGLARRILNSIVRRGKQALSNPEEATELLAVSTYCIAAVAYENCSGQIVEEYIRATVTERAIDGSCFLSYILGCIRRQQGKDALALFEKAKQGAEAAMKEANPQFAFFLGNQHKDIYVDALRSIGTIYKRMPGHESEARDCLQEAGYYARLYNTTLQYATMYSEGYYLMASFFEDASSSDSERKKVAMDAHRAFSESLGKSPRSTPTLIRMGLLETALEQYQLARGRLDAAREAYKDKGLLTDLEYLNSWLNELILLSLVTIQEREGIQPPPHESTRFEREAILTCTSAGKNDVQCVIKDVGFLKRILERKGLTPGVRPRDDVDGFDSACKDLLDRLGRPEQGRLA